MTRLDCGLHAGQGTSHVRFFVVLVTVLESCKALGSARQPAERFHQDLPQYEVVHPTRVDVRGHFLSNFLCHRSRRVQRRDASEESMDQERVFYQLWHAGHSLHFNLTLNPHLLAPGFLSERRYGGLKGTKIRRHGTSQCHFLGEVRDEAAVKGSAAISTCDGLTGLFKLSDEEFFIQPLEKSHDESSERQAHAIYKRHAPSPFWSPLVESISGIQTVNASCGVKKSHHRLEETERQREHWEQTQQRRRRRRRRIRQRSVSKEKWVETLVVADPKMVEYHGSKGVESYVLAVMNIVAGLFQDASIGNAINIVVVRLVVLEQDEDDLKITHHADNSLSSFCKWQKGLNVKGDDHPLHHDVAVLLTRKDICASINMPCETLGLSHVAGMCQSHRSCSISEDTGLPLAFTVAHELGHNFGIQHDGNGNDCEPVGKRPFIMSPQLLYGTSLPRWSRCSRQYITRFLDRGWGRCLDDAPVTDTFSHGLLLPGILYSAAHQCRLQYGSGSMLCDDMDNVCSTLWCTVGTTCHSKLDGAVDGTSCGKDKWCFGGECVVAGHHPDSVNGAWGSWTEWTACSRSCGAGVQSAQRDCDDPVPKNRGKYCLGERQRYRICNTTPCQSNIPTFRDIQCSNFNSAPYKGKFYNWVAVINRVSPCELHCRPLNEHFSEKMRDAVLDGTPCLEGNKSRDMCVNGICKNVGCDYVIESNAVEDRCGICHGNGSTCTTIRKTFEESEGLGYVDIGLIPEGSWDIRIEEMAAAGNFLALRGDNPSKYYLNGGWTIQWNGEYKAAGTVFTYERTGHLENLTSPGPTTEPLWIQLLFQESNPGVRYEYTISQNVADDNNIPASVFFWKYGSWTECSVTCGAGVQRQIVHCVERTNGIVDETFCDPLTRPDDNQTSCNKDPCPAIWWVGEWHKCSASCGSSGMAKRTVLCIQAISVEEQQALQHSECEHIPKPESVSSCNTHIPCPADWTTGSWSKCSLTCGSGVRRRNVVCSRNTGVDCDLQSKPQSVSTCNIQDCPQVVDNFGGIDWSGSGWTSKEVFNEINSIPKYSPTKVQSKNPDDLNNILEDFHYHNRIESDEGSLGKSLKVDDFYYDYNFINFHEDLSDESDGTESRDSQEIDFPQEEEPPHSGKDTSHSSKPAEPHIINPGNVKDNGNSGTEEPAEIHSETFDDDLFWDYFLPVSTTRSPPLSTTEHSSVLKERYNDLLWSENISTRPPLEVTTRHPTKTENMRQDREQAKKNHDSSAEENHTEISTVTPTHAASTSILQDENRHTVTLTASTQEEDDLLLQNSYTATHFSPPQVLKSPSMPGTDGGQIKMNKHALQMEANTFEISTSQITNESIVFSPALILADLDPTHHSTDSGLSHHGLITTSLPPSESQTPLLSPDILMPSNQNVPDDVVLSTGTQFIPPPDRERYSQPPPDDYEQATVEPIPSKPASIERTTTDPASFFLYDFDYSEVVVPPTHLHLWPRPLTSVQTPTPTQVTAYWVTGNWSSCSTSCGLGAIWRTLACSTGSEFDCDPAKRPTPAQRCYLRPCSMWKIGEWSKCSKNCGVSMKSRDVQCFDMRDQRPLRPFHCRAMSIRPQSQTPCHLQPCLDWYTSSWGQCSEVCGGGGQQRIVTCPEEGQCDIDLQPSNIRRCNTQPCAQWLTGSWGQCSVTCGSGVQRRLIKCVNTKAEKEQEVDQAQCDHQPQPDSTQKCNLDECQSAPSGATCLADRLSSRFCQTLRWLGRCQLPNVRAQCCKTCNQPPARPGSTSRH
ncbi:A disintegrin and metalloproteinase with thrombospondin motifs 7 isoform X3 [Dunckerocampus dactyliophorus]|uniref:A disintegrin and metalloproteinase with thrombospondin motifs 7 isoform X3 n=1 Tax=Dunckerocampus dactyliophorus TaxID=161453 RepID=UPI00240505EE|nr:A disintegrin and metalloproteinase with thrombospondin motifs 7 isoform X3 [Dunckerocampus dactyliophorus]